MKVAIINSFVYNDEGGNPAGVVLDLNQNLKEAEMQAIAKKIGVSETAFITKGTHGADFNLKFFTPIAEVSLCGHATIASFWYLSKLGLITSERCVQNTRAGLLELKITKTDQGEIKVTMAQSEPKKVKGSLPFDHAFKASFPNAILNKRFPIDVWSTGLEDILLPLKNLEALNNLKIDFKALSTLSDRVNVVGVHAFALEGEEIHARNFAPLYGIDEESATGTSNGALTAYLHHYLHPNLEQLDLRVIQGEQMGMTSSIYTTSIKKNGHYKIWVGGFCHFVEELDI